MTTNEQKIQDFLTNCRLGHGVGTESNPCSIAAINLALTGRLTDEIPECMSPVIGRWIVGVQDAMPIYLINSDEWRRLLPLAAGTGHAKEQERLDMIMQWMWNDVLPTVQPLADQLGFGEVWSRMTTEKTFTAAYTAASAATSDAARAAANAAADAAEMESVYWNKVNPSKMLNELIARR